MPYNPALVAPMRQEMTSMGARELTSAADVDVALGDQRGTMLVFVNSVCGCAAGNARPALRLALQHGVKPGQVVTVFAGQDLEATSRARQYFAELDILDTGAFGEAIVRQPLPAHTVLAAVEAQGVVAALGRNECPVGADADRGG